MDYDNGFILQKTMVNSNRSVDWSLLNDGMIIPVSACAPISCITRSQNNDSTNIIIISPRSSSARLLPSGRKNYHRIIHKNTPTYNHKKFQFQGSCRRFRFRYHEHGSRHRHYGPYGFPDECEHHE